MKREIERKIEMEIEIVDRLLMTLYSDDLLEQRASRKGPEEGLLA